MKALEIKDLTKIFKGGTHALKNINLEVEEGSFFGLLGPNGAGKTTLIGVLSSLVNTTSGTVKIFGHDISKDLETAKTCLGVVPQEFNFNIFEKVETIILNQAGYYGISRKHAKENTHKYLQTLGLWDKRHTQANQLSGGMKRRLMIARALAHEPRMLILDEPTAGVDIELRRSMWDFLRKLNADGITIILTTHYLEEAEMLCRDIAIINCGEMIENTSTRALLGKLNIQTFIFELAHPISVEQLNGQLSFPFHLSDPHTLEINLSRGQNLNTLFYDLKKINIIVESMRNKANRLEELFLKLLGKKET